MLVAPMRQGEGAIERNTLRGQSVSTNGTIINHIVLFNNRENPDIVEALHGGQNPPLYAVEPTK